MQMKKRDSMSGEIRESMKQVIREKGFGYWFKEVFWYHYGKLSVCILAALIIAVLITVEGMGQKKFDFNMVIASESGLTEAYITELESVVANAVGDIDGNGEININIQILGFGGTESQRLQLAFAQEEYALFIMNDHDSAIYAGHDYFDPPENYGFEPDELFAGRIDINDAPILQRINSYTEQDMTFYAGICDWTVNGKGKKEWTDAAVRALNAIINAE